MAILPIVKFGDPALRLQVTPVTKFDKELGKLVDSMVDTMYDAPGVGLAANQIGVIKSLFVMDTDDELEIFTNPKIISLSEETDVVEEGCLSLPEVVKVPVVRSKALTVEVQLLNGKKEIIEAEGLRARAIQHELDHLNGVMIIDRIPKEHRKDVMRQLKDSILSEDPGRVHIHSGRGIL